MNGIVNTGTPQIITSTTTVRTSPGTLLGFYVNSTSSGKIVLYDAASTSVVGGYQDVLFTSAKTGASATDLANDATVYTAAVVVDGGGSQPIAVTGSAAQTYTTLITELNTDTTGATWSIVGGNLRCTSTRTGSFSSIAITDTDLFAALTDFDAIDTAVAGTTSTGVITGTITPTIGWKKFPLEFVNGLQVDVGGTINTTFIVRPR